MDILIYLGIYATQVA